MDNNTFISEMGEDFSNFAEVLKKEKSLEALSSKLYILSSKLKGKKDIYYKTPTISIEFEVSEKFPKRFSHQKSAIDLVLKFDIEVKINNENLIQGNDPFNIFGLNILIHGKNKNNQNSKIRYAIHFDRHNKEEEKKAIEKDKGKPPIQPHPAYHFQFGGNKLTKEEIDYGQALFLDSPRIMHHPMEFILAIDFILSNFFPRIWQKIKSNRQYKKIIQKYQKQFIKPYFQSIAHSFNSDLPQNWNAQEIYPQLVKR